MPLANEEITQPPTVVQERLPATPMEMLARAVMRGADPATMERLLDMQERWERNEARKAFAKAIAKARAKIGPIFKNREANMGAGKPKYSYETLDEIERSVVPALSEHGLSYRWNTEVPQARPDLVIVRCRIEHEAGYYEENSLAGPADTSGAKNPIQAIGSALTYLQRYTLKAALGLSASIDDDGAGREPEEKITEAELVQLRERIMQVGQTEERVCNDPAIDIKRLEDLPRSKFEPVMRRLEKTAKK